MDKLLNKLPFTDSVLRFIRKETDKIKMLHGKQLAWMVNTKNTISDFSEVEFSIFSQWGDDGIIQFLINKIPNINKSFIEFGVENYRESNTRFLLCNNNWRGLVFDGSTENIRFIQKDSIYWKHNLTAEALFITKENINQAIRNNNFSGDLGILHIDIDGNDYWIWESITEVNPSIVIMEYNSCFGKSLPVSIPYSATFQVRNAHHSGLYYGASISALCHLATQKGYVFVGCNTNGNNSYFVKKEYADLFLIHTPESGYIKSEFRQNRDSTGNLTFKNDHEILKNINPLPLVNVITGEMLTTKNL